MRTSIGVRNTARSLRASLPGLRVGGIQVLVSTGTVVGGGEERNVEGERGGGGDACAAASLQGVGGGYRGSGTHRRGALSVPFPLGLPFPDFAAVSFLLLSGSTSSSSDDIIRSMFALARATAVGAIPSPSPPPAGPAASVVLLDTATGDEDCLELIFTVLFDPRGLNFEEARAVEARQSIWLGDGISWDGN